MLTRSVFPILAAVLPTLIACSSSNDNPLPGGAGGAATVGGATVASNGGSANPANGGTTANPAGGANANRGGAATGNGGSATSNGGSSTSNGGNATGNGGTATGNGGTSATNGGSTSKGGTSATSGGSTATAGGGTSKGGSTANAGGSSSVGGKASGGSTSASGGTTSASGGTSTAAGGTSTGSGVQQSSSCPSITWPSATGTPVTFTTKKVVTAAQPYDGKMAVHTGPSSIGNCKTGDQASTTPLIEVEDGGTVKNIVMGETVGDGIHCLGSCTIENVWFPYVCDDAITSLGSGTVTIKNSGFKNARDKTIQHNGTATVNIENVFVDTAGKLYRSCGAGCDKVNRTANLTGIVAIGVDQVAGAGLNDTITLKNICTYRTPTICEIYNANAESVSVTGVNSTGDGPAGPCKYTAGDTHALLNSVTGQTFSTDAVCGGVNGYKTGSSATACVTGYEKCLKMCMPGGYGFKELNCVSGKYAEATGCAMPTDPTAAANLAGSKVGTPTSPTVSKNSACTTEWATATDGTNPCVCVKKAGEYGTAWTVWDCQAQWW